MSGPYSRVYWSVMSDEKFDGVREDMRLFGAWTLLLIVADMSWPAPAFIPSLVSKQAFAKLVEAGLVDVLTHGRFKVHGLDAEREQRSMKASQSAQLRWDRPKVEGGKPASRRTRFKVLERDGYRCRYCGRTSQTVAMDVDHVIPVREGGTDDMDNLVAACVDCNAGKSGHQLRAHVPKDARALLGKDETSKDETSKPRERHEDDDGRLDLEAFLLVRHRIPTPRQREFMDAYLKVFDVTGPQRAERVILSHPDDPIGALKADLEAFRAERRAALPAEPRRRVSGPNRTLLLAYHNGGEHIDDPDPDCPACKEAA